MNYILKGHNYIDDVVSILMMFYPNDKYIQSEEIGDSITVISTFDKIAAKAELYYGNELKASAQYSAENDSIREIKRVIGLSIAKAVNSVLNIPLPWGILTGVRPAKLVSEAWLEGQTTNDIRATFKDKYLVSDEKLNLMIKVAEEEKKIVEGGLGKAGLYIGIPFCPTRCLYCSFTSYPLKQYSNRVDAYLEALIKEMDFCKEYFFDKEIESLYIGGGTPASLNEKQLDKLLTNVEKCFKIPVEFTVEAGRPDTITEEKLKILKEHNVSRISINPQTLNDETLRLIGREHSVDMFLNAFEMARKAGHKHINTDIILGLPGEGEKEVTNTMEGLMKLNPESITVHTLAVKRASRLKETLENYNMTDALQMDRLINISREYTEKMGMSPYYMYRQKNMVGNFENVGYCKAFCQCIYNVAIMEEKQSIIALGAGGSTKIVDNKLNKIERVFNVKSVDDYITRIDEMIDRKRSFIYG
ncbi:MAG: coproporphyrinogen dehydrogenase HemZ [Clostridia bacterium]|nr:coproporphyrinogen dehydrogenase HemZ [Clostridia bacterium]